jgi:integrase
MCGPISAYLTELARAGAKVGTMSRRLSSIRFAHQLRDLPDPTTGARVVAVWEGIRRTHGAPPDQAAPLMPPALFDVLDACPQTKVWKTRPPEPDLAGLRDRALLLVGFFAALRRSELAALRVEEISAHDRGLVLSLPRSKTNQRGEEHELVVLPRAGRRAHCPVTAVQTWLDAAGIADGPVFRKISRGNRVLDRALHPESINDLVQAAIGRAGLQGGPFSAHSLRAGFVTLRAPARRVRSRDRPPDPAPLPGHPRRLRPARDGLAGQRGHPTRAVRATACLRLLGPTTTAGPGRLALPGQRPRPHDHRSAARGTRRGAARVALTRAISAGQRRGT